MEVNKFSLTLHNLTLDNLPDNFLEKYSKSSSCELICPQISRMHSEVMPLNIYRKITYYENIAKKMLQNLSDLSKLYLEINKIEMIDENMFASCPKLRHVNIMAMNLEYLPNKLFKPLVALKSLRLLLGNIETISKHQFRNNHKLTNLSLHIPFISIPVALFKKNRFLRHIIVKYISVGNSESLDRKIKQGLKLLHTLLLDFNVINTISSTCFKYSKNLKILQLNGNRLNRLNTSDLNLDELHLTSNEIKELTIRSGNKIRVLNLENNKLKELFKVDLKGLDTLNLKGNNILELDSYHFQQLSNLRVLDMRHNRIKVLDDDIFEQMILIEEMQMRGNIIEELPSTVFASLRNLKFLDLGNNMIKDLPFNLFHNNKALEELYLDNNNLVNLNSTLFNTLPKLLVLSLHENQFRSLPEDLFEFNVSLIDVSVDYNIEHCAPRRWKYLNSSRIPKI